MSAEYSVRVSQDDWDSQEVRCAWASLVTECSDPGRVQKCPEFIDHLRTTHDPSQFHLVTVRDGVRLRRQARILRVRSGGKQELRRFDSPHQADDLVRIINGRVESAGLRPWGRSAPLTVDRAVIDSLAGRGLLLTYLLMGDGQPCAALTGLQYRGVYYLDATPRDRLLDRFSPGSTAFHLAIEDLIRNTSIRRIDLGFGEPAHPHHYTSIVEPRASLLLMRKTSANRLRWGTHAIFQSLINFGKKFSCRYSSSVSVR